MLRVIGGTFGSRKIKEVKSDKTRPTTDRNREAVFNILGQYFSGGIALDLFAGSGALGIEAISRGMDTVDFVDNTKIACLTIKENLQILGILDQGNIHRMKALRFLNETRKQYDLILADPPYAQGNYQELLETIVSRQLLKINGIIVFEADKQVTLPNHFKDVICYKEKTFGNTKFGFYRTGESQ